MNENLLQFIWKNRFFRNGPYHTIEGSFLEILNTGTHNLNQGPDFLNARIKIENTEWAGNIELHIHASDWHKHEHTKDPNFRNIILHVVWINDIFICDVGGLSLPTFCIQPYISNYLLSSYKSLMLENPFAKPCFSFLPAMSPLKWLSWKERLVVERLERKAKKICKFLEAANQDWEMITWWLLAGNMGLKVNEHLFESVAKSIPLRIIRNHRNQIQQLEAILMGQANLLGHPFEELYPQMLQKEYQFLQKKYCFEKQRIYPAYLRMRPASFPTLRMAQLAVLMQENEHFFNFFKHAASLHSVQEKLMVKPNDYWLYHYRFDDPGLYKEKKLGISMVNSIIINTVIPIIFTYGLIMKEPKYQERALNWLMELGSEKNKITNSWISCQICNRSAFDSQALLELSNAYCHDKRCLDCAVGTSILGTPL
jgi:hypothetical protein